MLRSILAVAILFGAVVTSALADPGAREIDERLLADFRGRFTALDDPRVLTVSEASHLAPGEEVLGITINGQSRAYPAAQLGWHHIVNDTLGDQPVAVTYCSVCSSGVSFAPVLEGKRHSFDVYGLYEGVMVMYDRQTESIWTHLGGECTVGPFKGRTLSAIPTLNTTWAEWKRLHPETTVLDENTPFRDQYRKGTRSGAAGVPPMFHATMSPPDTRLPENTLLIAVLLEGRPRAYPHDAIEQAGGVAEEILAGTPVALLYDATTKSGAAVDRRLDDRTLSFERVTTGDQTRFRDRETASLWTVEGECVAGALAGRHLKRVFALQTEWYGWSAYFPHTSVYGSEGDIGPVAAR